MKIGWLISFLSSFIVTKDIVCNDLGDYVGKGFIHTPIILESMLRGKTGIIDKGLLYARQGNSSSYNKYKYFGENFYYILKSFQKKGLFDDKTINLVINQWIQNVILGNIYIDKVNGKFRLKDGWSLIKTYNKINTASIKLYLYIFTPRLIYKVRRKI